MREKRKTRAKATKKEAAVVADFLPPSSWKEFTEQADDALAAIEKMEKTPLPETVEEAMEDGFFEDPGDGLSEMMGATDPEEIQRWNTRVMSLRDANAILRKVETDLVRGYVLSPNSAFRIMYDGAIKIPRWIIEHTAELLLVLVPLIYKGANAALDATTIEIRIEKLEKSITANFRILSRLSQIAEGTVRATSDELAIGDLEAAMQEVESQIGIEKREIAALTKLLRRASNYLEFAAEAVLVLAVWFSMEKLLTLAGSATAISAALDPARDLKDEAIEAAQKKAFPQAPQKRTVTYKRSRRN
jgi:hypothetical protein